MRLEFHHVDVFATGPLTGNGLAVFLDAGEAGAATMQELTREMRQFESVFLSEITASGAAARIFTVDEELPFAGHPVLGAAAVLHRTQAPGADMREWVLRLAHGPIAVRTQQLGGHYLCEMNQGVPASGPPVPAGDVLPVLERLGLSAADMDTGLGAEVISTGLPYLILPVTAGALARAGIAGSDFEEALACLGAKFVLVLDVRAREMRTWDNLGLVEDVATGSAAGPAAAYLLRHGLADPGSEVVLAQGRFAGRPSRLTVVQDGAGNLLVSGEVWPLISGRLDVDTEVLDRR